jgi:phosphatidylglycerophosphate synthase
MPPPHLLNSKVAGVREIHCALKKDYRGSQKSSFDKENYFFRWYRSVSFLPTAILIRFGVSANTVTAWGAVCLLCAFGLLAKGMLLAGALLYLLAYLLDFIDGNIARYIGNPTYFGKMIDGLVDSLTFLLFIALGIGNISTGQSLLTPATEIFLGVATGFAFLLRTYFYLRISFILTSVQPAKAQSNHGVAFTRQARSSILQKGKKIHFGLISGMPVLLLLAVILNVVSVYLVGYFLLFSLVTIFEVVFGLRRVRIADIPTSR